MEEGRSLAEQHAGEDQRNADDKSSTLSGMSPGLTREPPSPCSARSDEIGSCAATLLLLMCRGALACAMMTGSQQLHHAYGLQKIGIYVLVLHFRSVFFW